jgi:defect-in-organelle-trafficking protein DotB
MRRKGDIILIGEMRDLETAEATSELGITGHMVFATLHADTPQESIFRLVEMFPEASRSAGAAKLLGSLRTICAVKIVVLKSGAIVPLRSWIEFDSQVKETLQSSEWPYPRWAAFVRQYVKDLGLDFPSQCIPYIKSGEMDATSLRQICQMTRSEAETYYQAVMEGEK